MEKHPSRRRSRRKSKSVTDEPPPPTDEEDDAYEQAYVREVSAGIANTRLLSDTDMLATYSGAQNHPVMEHLDCINRPTTGPIITGMPCADMTPMDMANIYQNQFPYATIRLEQLPRLSAADIRARLFSVGILISGRTILQPTVEWLSRCQNAPPNSQFSTLQKTCEPYFAGFVGEYQPDDDTTSRVYIYYCHQDVFAFVLVSQTGDIQSRHFYALDSPAK